MMNTLPEAVGSQETQQMDFRLIIASSCLFVAACASPGLHEPSRDIDKPDLLSGEAIFGTPVDSGAVPDPGLFEVDEAMRAFVAEHVGNARTGRERMRRLLDGMVTSGLMSIDYDDSATKTAPQTFHDRVGNCMSFTSLFVVLAREAGLEVTFQIVAVPPTWYADSDLIILNDHVNALVRQEFGKRVIVDFNATELKGNYETEPVSDAYAQALYFNNIAMDALRERDYEQAFRLLKKAIQTHPDIAGNWANLGVIYSRNKLHDHAIAAYSVALDIDSKHRPSLNNLAYLYRSLGDDEKAEYYAKRIRRYNNQNPYYHYYQALASYRDGEYQLAESQLKRALWLKSTEHNFYKLRGLIAEATGDTDLALYSFTRAHELAAFSDAQSIYSAKIEMLKNRD
jgi:Flp pilus assembly protein TadD